MHDRKEANQMPLSCKMDGRKMTAQITGEVDHHRAKQLMLDLERKIEISYAYRFLFR